MKRFIVLVGLFLIFPLPARAACSEISVDASCPAGKIKRDYTLDIAGTAQCTSGTNGPKRVCCDTQTEANAVDSVRAPLCGSSVELGKNNSTCWTCDDGSLRCAGLDSALGETDDAIYLNRASIDGGDTSQVWRVTSHPSSFKFNGIDYTHTGDLIVCTANNKACGASNTQCHGLYPEDEQPSEQAAPIVVPGETNFTNIRVGKTLRVAYNLIQSAGLLDFYLRNYTRVKPNEDILNNPALEKLSLGVFNATSQPLKPLMLQQTTVDATNCQKFQVTGRICVYDKDGALINTREEDQTVSTKKYESGECNPTKVNERRQGFEQLAAISTKYDKVDQNYEKPLLDIAIDKPLLCDVEDKTVDLPTNLAPSVGENFFPQPGNPIGKIAASLFQKISDLFAQTSYTIVYKATILNPYEAWSWCQSTGCADPALTRVQYPIEQAAVDGGGALETAQPSMHDFTKFRLHGGEEDQEFDTEFSPGEVKESETAFSYANRIKTGADYFFCMISPLMNNHLGLFNNGECDRDWQREKTTATSTECPQYELVGDKPKESTATICPKR